MAARLYIGNLAKSTTQDELNVLFTQAGSVIATDVIMDRRTGESRGFAFVTMSTQNEAEDAIRMFNSYSFAAHDLNVSMARLNEQHNGKGPIVEP